MAQWGKVGGRPTDRFATPDLIARVATLLLPDHAAYVRGRIIAVPVTLPIPKATTGSWSGARTCRSTPTAR